MTPGVIFSRYEKSHPVSFWWAPSARTGQPELGGDGCRPRRLADGKPATYRCLDFLQDLIDRLGEYPFECRIVRVIGEKLTSSNRPVQDVKYESRYCIKRAPRHDGTWLWSKDSA